MGEGGEKVREAGGAGKRWEVGIKGNIGCRDGEEEKKKKKKWNARRFYQVTARKIVAEMSTIPYNSILQFAVSRFPPFDPGPRPLHLFIGNGTHGVATTNHHHASPDQSHLNSAITPLGCLPNRALAIRRPLSGSVAGLTPPTATHFWAVWTTINTGLSTMAATDDTENEHSP